MKREEKSEELLKELQRHLNEYRAAIRNSDNTEAHNRHVFVLAVMDDLQELRGYGK